MQPSLFLSLRECLGADDCAANRLVEIGPAHWVPLVPFGPDARTLEQDPLDALRVWPDVLRHEHGGIELGFARRLELASLVADQELVERAPVLSGEPRQ